MPPDSQRELQRRASSRALQEAALRLVGERGFADVTVEEIAAAAGTSRRTFFNHFPTKAAALFDPDPDDADRLDELLREVDGAPDPWAALNAVCIALMVEHAHVVTTRRRLVEASPDLDRYHRTAQRHVEVALAAWTARQPSLDPFMARLHAESAGAVLTTAFGSWSADDDPALLCDLVDAGFAVLRPSLSPEAP